MHRSRTVLRALHAHEILMGMLTDTGANQLTGASVALRVLVEARHDGLTDEEILGRSPIVLALAPPRVAPEPVLPPEASTVSVRHDGDGDPGNDNGILREALRLRVRWMQELSGRAAWALGVRLTVTGELDRARPDPAHEPRAPRGGRHQAGRGRAAPGVDARARLRRPRCRRRFQLSDLGKPIRVATGDRGRQRHRRRRRSGRGPVTYDVDDPPAGSVLVTTTLTPASVRSCRGSTASWPRPARCCRTSRSSPARPAWPRSSATPERSEDLPEGTIVVVDGETGRVTVEEEEARREDHRLARRHRHRSRGRRLHGRVAQPVGVEPRPVLRADRPDRRGRRWPPGWCCAG